MREIFKYSILIFLYALSHSYLATCFAIDLKIQGYEERYIGLSLSMWGIGVIFGAVLHNLVRKKLNLYSTILYGSIIQLSFSLIFLIDQNTYLVALMQFVMGITSAINSLTLETYISSKDAMKEVVKSRLQEFGTAGNASSINSISLGEMSKKYKSGEFKAIIN